MTAHTAGRRVLLDGRALEPVEISGVDADDQSLSFDVDQVGVPVLVKMSYFPNWRVTGAEGPYRVAPNFMVVVPNDTHVELTYGRTSVEYLAYALTLLGVAGLVLLVRRPQYAFAATRSMGAGDERDDDAEQADSHGPGDAPPGEVTAAADDGPGAERGSAREEVPAAEDGPGGGAGNGDSPVTARAAADVDAGVGDRGTAPSAGGDREAPA